ncbi:MAG: class I SAM-dependent methyltransferase [Planctomycetota bacterium]|jgi:SAM-dependent methyltransferase
MGFDKASKIFDLYIDWERRLSREMPYLLERLEERSAGQVADVACGNGFHAAALAEAGRSVTAIDPDQALLDQALERAKERSVEIQVRQASFSELPGDLEKTFSAAFCLGNSISLVEPGPPLVQALSGLAGLLEKDGLLILHTINYPMIANRPGEPWGPVRTLDDGSLVLKGFVPRQGGPWDVLLLLLEPEESTKWQRRTVRFQVHPHLRETLGAAAESAGLALRKVEGGFSGESPEDPDSSDLIYEFLRQL